MNILNVTAQKPMSTGSGIYLTELMKVIEERGYNQALVAGVYATDKVNLPKKAKFYPVYFNTETMPFNIFGMSDEMPYPSCRYCDMTKEKLSKFKNEFLSAIKNAVDEIKPDIILCHHLYLLTSIVRENFPNHKVYGFCHNTDIRQISKHSLEKDYIIRNIRKLDRVFAPQKAQADLVTKIYGVDKITLLGVGYNQKLFNTEKRIKADGEIRLLFVGKIAEKKGVISLLRCLENLDIPENKLTLTLVGGAGNEEEFNFIKKLAEKSKYNIVFKGRMSIEKVAEIYKENDIFVLPSFFDAVPLVAIEALASGLKVVITELPGIREFFNVNIPNAPIKYVNLPKMQKVDEPIKEELPAFEKRLALAINESILDEKEYDLNLSGLSWEGVLDKVLK